MENPINPDKTAREVLGDYLKEIVGYENGLLRTIIDLRKQPAVVLKGYLAKDTHYVSPFRILIGGLSLWVLVNGFFLDWYKAWENAMYEIDKYLQFIKQSKNPEKLNNAMPVIAKMYGTLAGDLFSKFFVPLILILLPIAAYLAAKKCKQYGVDFKTLLAALAYSLGLNVLLMFVVSVSAYFNLVITFIVIGVPAIILTVIGKGNLIALAPLRKFFDHDGVEIEKRLTIAQILAVAIVFTPIGVYWFFQMKSIIETTK